MDKRRIRTLAASLAAGALLAPVLVVMTATSSLADEGDTVWTTGLGAQGQLGNGSTASRTSFGQVASLLGVDEVHGGREHVLALVDGAVWAWGDGIKGATGLGSTAVRTMPTLVSGVATGTTTVTNVSTGHYHSLALLSDGTVRSWGFNAMGQLGDGTTTKRLRPVTVAGLSTVTDIVGGRDMSYALLADGTVRAWGGGANGELGNGSLTARQTRPVSVSGLSGVVAMAGGRNHGRRAQVGRVGHDLGAQHLGTARRRHEDLALDTRAGLGHLHGRRRGGGRRPLRRPALRRAGLRLGRGRPWAARQREHHRPHHTGAGHRAARRRGPRLRP